MWKICLGDWSICAEGLQNRNPGDKTGRLIWGCTGKGMFHWVTELGSISFGALERGQWWDSWGW